ncbi:MAG: hypothetical protein ABL921_13615 [Pirellula sp.]
MNHLTKMLTILRNAKRSGSSKATSRRRFGNRLRLERLEERALMAGFNDPDYATLQWGLDNVGQNGGTYDVDIDAPEAWTVTTGSMKTVVAEIERGVPYTHPDIYLNIWLNQAEIPATLRTALSDTDGDGLITFRDLNNPANTNFVTDFNGTGYIDGGDLLQDLRWANGVDDGMNGKVDDLVGWDFIDNDNDPSPPLNDNHGLRMTQWIGAIPDNGVGYVGMNRLVSVMPIRIVSPDPSWDYNPQTAAAGLDYSNANGASIAGIWGGGYTFSQVLYNAIDQARLKGQLVVVPSMNNATNIDVTPVYPASFDLDNIISVTAFNANDRMDSAWNWGPTTVDLASPTNPGGGTSGGAANVVGVAALLQTINPSPDWDYQWIKSRILSTVEPSAALVGKCLTGGRLNAANALGYAWPATKFFVVNDATYDQTYEYQATNQFVTANGLDAGNTAPRGAASNVDGSKVWVVDANKKVYVYNASGGLLGSWTAGGLNAQAQLEGISTNGTDVWLVDKKQDKVFKYTGAASRLSGSQTAASSFSLNGSNTSPTDLVTDGSSIWVLNDTLLTDKVFKYNVSGTLLGSWTITSGGGSPTGLTIDPANVSNIWIVDNNTDRVYQFDAATGRTSGSASPTSSFALSAGNTNPQGIADPPPPASSQTRSIVKKQIFTAEIADAYFAAWSDDPLLNNPQKRTAGKR